MMNINSQDIVPLGQVRAKFTELAEQVHQGAEKIITRNGQSYVALVDAKKLDFYHQLEQNYFQQSLFKQLETATSAGMAVNELEPPAYDTHTTTPGQAAIDWKAAWYAASGMWKDHAGVESDIQQIRASWHKRIEP